MQFEWKVKGLSLVDSQISGLIVTRDKIEKNELKHTASTQVSI